MKNLWNDEDAQPLLGDELALRVYTSRLLGCEPELVLHGGGNTSVKVREPNFFGENDDILYVKGSGWDLATIEKAGFAPIRMEILYKLAKRDHLSDADMVAQMRVATTDATAPIGSVEAILHAVLPFTYVDHTHANAVIALTNNERAEAHVREVYGDRVLIVPYIMPGFILAREVYRMIRNLDFSEIEGIVLLNHGIFTFGDDAKTSYERMIGLVSEAEAYLDRKLPGFQVATGQPKEDLIALAEVRRSVSEWREKPVFACVDASPEACGFSKIENVDNLATRGPLTPDHVIRTKRVPVILRDKPVEAIEIFTQNYINYFQRFAGRNLAMLDPAPRWGVWPGWGTVSFGTTIQETQIISDIVRHTLPTMQQVESLGGWRPLKEQDLFEIEYWELEQAKLSKAKAARPLEGKVALITGSAAGIGRACLEALHEDGAAVVGLDLSPEIEELQEATKLGLVCNLTDSDATQAAVEETVRRFGGLDILVSNAGIFTAGAYIEDLELANWDKSMAVNLTSHQRLLHHCIPYLKRGLDATAIFIGSRNVAAPGAGAASYSVAKAGLTQLVRVAALELAKENVRVNIVHPDAVFDTKLWTPEVLARSAERYNMTVEEYKTRNLLGTEIRSADVGRMVATMASPVFGKTTGAQIPVDGGNDRVI